MPSPKCCWSKRCPLCSLKADIQTKLGHVRLGPQTDSCITASASPHSINSSAIASMVPRRGNDHSRARRSLALLPLTDPVQLSGGKQRRHWVSLSMVRPQSRFRDATHIGVQIDRQTGSRHTCPLASVIFVTDQAHPPLQTSHQSEALARSEPCSTSTRMNEGD